VYDKPPVAVKFTGTPEHTVLRVGVMAIVGTGKAFTATVAAPKHVPSETATVYTVFTFGLTIMLGVLFDTGYQEYEVAAAAEVKVAVLPAQTVDDELMSVTGNGAIEMVVTAVVIPQPF
jgi:hypothetical protein